MVAVIQGFSSEKSGFVEYKMPIAMANAYLASRKDSEKKRNPQDFLVDIVNKDFGLKGHCVKVITY
jgi:hypothetical protein